LGDGDISALGSGCKNFFALAQIFLANAAAIVKRLLLRAAAQLLRRSFAAPYDVEE
jgi:hypothetical protein